LTLGKRNDGVVAFAIGADARREEECAVAAECKPARKRHDSWRQNALPSVFQRRRQSHDRARAAQSDVITPVGPESTATRVQLRDSSGVPYDFPVPIERQDPIAAAVEEEQFLPLIDDKPARVGNTRVVAEGAERPAVAIESKQGSISIAVDTRRACNEERHDNITVSVPPRAAARFSDQLSKSLRQESILLKDRHWEGRRLRTGLWRLTANSRKRDLSFLRIVCRPVSSSRQTAYPLSHAPP
jgi:hypothetical protein